MRIRNPNISSDLTYLFYSFFIACLFLLLKGYQFNTGDQAEHLPLVYKLADGSLYASDYYVPHAEKAFTVRFFYVYLLHYLSFVFPLPAVCFFLTLACLTLTAYSFMKMTREFTIDLLAPYIAPLLVLFVFYGFTAGGNHIQYPMFIGSSLAKALGAYALYLFFRRHYRGAGLLLGAAALFQVLAALQLFTLLAVALLLTGGRGRLRRLGDFSLTFLSISSFMLFPILYRQFFTAGDYDRDLFYEVLYVFRNPLHYLPSLFPSAELVRAGVLCAAGLAILFFMRLRVDKVRVTAVILTAVLGMAAYTLLLEVMDVQAIGKTQWFKTTVWTSALGAVLAAVVLSALLQRIVDLYLVLAYMRNVVLISTALMLAVLLNSGALPEGRLDGRYQAGNYRKSDRTLVHEWISTHTPEDAVFLYDPANSAFACEARRSSLCGYKAIIHEPFFLIPWYGKFSAVYDVTAEEARAGNALELASAGYRTRYLPPSAWRYDYRLDNLRECAFADSLGRTVYRRGDWVLSEAK